MKAFFQTPDIEIVNKNRDKLGNYAKGLFQDYYNFLKKDIVSSLSNNKEINLDNHKEDFKNILKIIYKRILHTNPNSLLKNYKIEANTKANLTIENIEDIQNQVFNVVNSQIEDTANTRTDLIFTNLIEKINYLYQNSQSTYLLNLQKLLTNLQDVNNEISQYDSSLNANYIKDILKSLNEKKQTLLREIEKQNNEKKQMIMLLFLNNYDNQIVKEKAINHSMNEVDNFEEKQRDEEANVLKNIGKIIIGGKILHYVKENTYGEWITQRDEKVRITHNEADGQIVKGDELFKIRNLKTGFFEYTNRPKGDGLSVGNSINCRCIKRLFIAFQLERKPEYQMLS